MPMRRNGQTTAYCTYCGKEIPDVAYIVEARDVTRLLSLPSGATNILHYNCISVMFQISVEGSE